MTIHLQRMENDEHFRRAFMFFDKDGSGYIESNELLESLADDSGETDTEVLNDIMREVDTDKVRLSSLIISLFYSPPFEVLHSECTLFYSPPFEALHSECIGIQSKCNIHKFLELVIILCQHSNRLK